MTANILRDHFIIIFFLFFFLTEPSKENGDTFVPVNLSTQPRSPKSSDSPIPPEDSQYILNVSSKPPTPKSEDRGHPERKRRASDDSCEVNIFTSIKKVP